VPSGLDVTAGDKGDAMRRKLLDKATDHPFGIVLKCTLSRCIEVRFSYYPSTQSFAQNRVRVCVFYRSS
jgi:hypothetical protein